MAMRRTELVQQKAWERAIRLLEGVGATPLFTIDTYQSNNKIAYPVRCNTCGQEYKAKILTYRTTHCPHCLDHKQADTVQRHYDEAMRVLDAHGYRPLFTREEFRGFKPQGNWIKYPVECTRCGAHNEVYPNGRVISDCKSCNSPSHKSFNGYIERCHKDGFEPLFTFADWQGSEQEYPVKCKKCGRIITSRIRKDQHISCPTCRKIANTQYSWEWMMRQCERDGVTFIGNRENWDGVKESRGTSRKLLQIPFRCNACGTEFHQALIRNSIIRCPICKPDCRARHKTWIRFQALCKTADVTPVIKEGEFRGLQAKNRVRCNKCGEEYEACLIPGQNVLRKCICQQFAGGGKGFRSNREVMLEEFIRSLGFEVVICNRTILRGYELDLVVPEKKVAFEINGLWFHSLADGNPDKKTKDYHAQKTAMALEAGYNLYHIWEDTPDDLVRSVIMAKLGCCSRVPARSLQYKVLSRAEGAAFFAKNHVDGNNSQASHYLGLVGPNGAILCAISLLRRRVQRSGEFQWEIGRFANQMGTLVVGGYSRLLKHAVSILKENGARVLVSYCNRDLSPDHNNTFYYKAGFQYMGNSGPIYWYAAKHPIEINGRCYHGRVPRQVVQKQKLLQHYRSHQLGVSPTDTERTLCERLGLSPVYNSGNFRFELPL